MSAIPKEQILRLNCPGYGEESYLNIGKARSIDSYTVVVVNPVSILHLFDKEPDTVREIDNKLNEGMTSFSVRSDELLNQLENDLKKRIFELVSFLEKGGLLIYYLCRPFLIQSPTLAMDNYYWLESLAPDTPAESNVRHMSAVSHGRIVEPTEQGDRSEFAEYLKQPGVEWNTIIRTDFLTEGYIVLATAGPRKCISAHLIAGDNGGRIIFLPAPYSPDFDRSLMDAVRIWYERRGTADDASDEASPPEPVASKPPLVETAPVNFGLSEQQASPSVSRGMPESRSYGSLPPVPKFSATTSRPMPGAPLEEGEKKGKLSAEEILASVSAQVEKAGTSDVGSAPFNERTTADIHTAFSALNSSLPQQEEPSGKEEPSGPDRPSDLLKELEDMSAEDLDDDDDDDDDDDAAPTSSTSPTAVGGSSVLRFGKAGIEPSGASSERKDEGIKPVQPRNLLRELESMSDVTFEKPASPPPGSTPRPRTDEKSFFEALSSKVSFPAEGKSNAESPELRSSAGEIANKAEDRTSKNEDKFSKPGQWYPPAKSEGASQSEESVRTPLRRAQELSQPEVEGNETAAAASESNQKTEPSKVQREESVAPEFGVQESIGQPPDAKDLIKKMEEMTKTVIPDWAAEFSFPDLEELRNERDALLESIRQTQTRIGAIENKINVLDSLKNSLLAADGEDLRTACSKVFKRLGWSTRPSGNGQSSEILLAASGEQAEVIARVVRSAAQAARGDVAQLSQSLIDYWGETEVEPKGVLVACTFANRPPSDRNEADFSDGLADFAQKKSLCLMTTLQLLCIYRDLELGKIGVEDIRRKIVDTNGRLSGFQLEPVRSKALA